MKTMLLKRIWKAVFYKCINNILINNILIVLKKDDLIKRWIYNWETWGFDENKSLDENVGCSPYPEIIKAIEISHEKLNKTVTKYCKQGDSLFDFGCGVGLYLQDFNKKGYALYAIDMNNKFIEKAKELVPDCTFYLGNYLKTEIKQKFDFIYSFSVFQYIERSQLHFFFDKIYRNLNKGGICFISYPHATTFKDTLYPNLSYIRYSPKTIENVVKKQFKIIEHKHFYDDRIVGRYDHKPYFFPDGNNNRLDTAMNGYVLILQKD
jgi:SAM-dependent methyltransferase